jgi:hypothetical protein
MQANLTDSDIWPNSSGPKGRLGSLLQI